MTASDRQVIQALLMLAIPVLSVSGTWKESFAQEAARPSASERIDFGREILPLLRERCHKCHGGVHRKAELSLLTSKEAFAILPSGYRAIVAGDPDASELVRRVESSSESERMPPGKDPLRPDEIALLRRWIAAGAGWDRHWSFQSIQHPQTLRLTGDVGWIRNAVDAFILKRLNSASITPSPEADRRTLIRRLYLDLIGILPRVDEVDAFCQDHRPDAYERLVDRLLASPHFGERWGRHWLDQARYADSDGFEVDGPRPMAWLWRDWVVQAMNEDMPFDRFTLEQLAGDMVPNSTESQRLATGFHRQSLTNREGGIDQKEAHYKELVDRLNAIGTVWLGMTLGCAQCHNHPYDPISQRDYFSLYAILNQSDDVDLPLVVPSPEVSHKRNEKYRGTEEKKGPRTAQVVTQSQEFRTTTSYHRGDFLQAGETVLPGFPITLLSAPANAASQSVPDRLALARWIIHPSNPLMPRVASNQIWLRLFGTGIVRTPDDFGARGEPPTHPGLLDWLAAEYQGNGWSTKQTIRRIVTSSTYRQSSLHRPSVTTLDPLNQLLHRQNRYRVEAELVHDISLSAAGLLTSRIGGPSFYPPLPEEVTKLSFRSNYKWNASTGSERYRRGMYIFYKRTLPHPNLDNFDCPDATVARMQRETSNSPLQALTSLNQSAGYDSCISFRGRGTIIRTWMWSFHLTPGYATSRSPRSSKT